MRDWKKIRKRIFEYAFLLVLLASVVLIYLSVASNIADIFAMNNGSDYTAVKEYLQDFGIKGAGVIAILEMLQMIVVFIPAEFVQIAAGLAYPIYFAFPICIAGICAGASVIFVIVRVLHIRLSLMEKRVGKIQRMVSKINKPTSMTIIMYLLFIMPIIPFGAICYFASSSKISYRRYIAVVATGVIPSVLSSYVLGNIMYISLGTGTTNFIITVAIAAVLMIILLVTVATLIKNKFFKKDLKKPNWFYHHLLYRLVSLFFLFKFKSKKKNCVKIKDKQFVLLSAHTSALDFYYSTKATYPKRMNVVANRYFADLKSVRVWVAPLHVIPKNLFAPDVETARRILSAKKIKSSIQMCPEGRLSSCGQGFPVAKGTAGLIKKLALPVYFQYTVGGYFAKPKWRSKYAKVKVDIYMETLFSVEDLKQMTELEIEAVLKEKFSYDECKAYALRDDIKKNTVDVNGLEKILYRCPECGAEFKTSSTKTTLKCSACGREYLFDDKYLCEGKTISDFYNMQKAELEKIENFDLQEECEVKVFNNKKGKLEDCGKGVCKLTNEEISFSGEIFGEQTNFSHTPNSLQALAFSAGEEFEFYVDGKLYYFYPKNSEEVIKWSMIWDVLQERNVNGKIKPEEKGD